MLAIYVQDCSTDAPVGFRALPMVRKIDLAYVLWGCKGVLGGGVIFRHIHGVHEIPPVASTRTL